MNNSHETTPESPSVQSASAHNQGSGRPKFRLRSVLMVVVPVAILALVAVASIGFFDLDAILGDLTRPTLAPASGQVVYQGQPLLNAQIMTQPNGGRGQSSLGWTDDKGQFSLKTDIRGAYVDGVTVGEHRVTVTAFGTRPGATAPPLLTPERYASMSTSPLRITVGRDSAKNQFQLVLEGEAPSRPDRASKGKSKQEPPEEP